MIVHAGSNPYRSKTSSAKLLFRENLKTSSGPNFEAVECLRRADVGLVFKNQVKPVNKIKNGFRRVCEEQSVIFSVFNTWKLPRTLQSHTMQPPFAYQRTKPCSSGFVFIFIALCILLQIPCVMYYLSLFFSRFFWCPYMAIDVNVQYNGGLLPDIILWTQCYLHQEVSYLQPLIPPKRFDIFSPITGGCSEGLGVF